MAARIEIWWTLGSEVAAPVAKRTASSTALPAAWRTGERARFARSVLKRYAGTTAKDVQLALAKGWRDNSGSKLNVSLSDARNYYVVGVGMGAPLGIDAEALRPVDDIDRTMMGLGLSRLLAAFNRLSPPARNNAFLRIWTAFESYLKLERLSWEEAAQRFAALEPHWSVGKDGSTRFQRERAGIAFEHVAVENKLLIGIATPISATIAVAHTDLPLRARASSGIAFRRTRT